MILESKSEKETKKTAVGMAEEFKREGGIVVLTGELGAGKTTFAQGFAEGLGITEKVISPTFVLIREYNIPGTEKKFFHIDLYRLEGGVNPAELGVHDMLNDGNVVLIEWADKLKEDLPGKVTKIFFKKISQNIREITVT